ncbi:hypothetical protein CEXT_581481 [Caerostris extrusa]|uniref:Uncharacterized protein n=1 Tax=Caerostris extrusa TaxID=172846 RepID=A0AAV4SK34_CAEEX|nr:hypothetical protein CEXT_581481 [Caerostris extrusa]
MICSLSVTMSVSRESELSSAQLFGDKNTKNVFIYYCSRLHHVCCSKMSVRPATPMSQNKLRFSNSHCYISVLMDHPGKYREGHWGF